MYRYFYAALCSYANRFVKDSEAAKDIVQSCIIHLERSDALFNDIKALTTYLYHSVYNDSLNFIRGRQNLSTIHSNYLRKVAEEEADAIYDALEEEVITRFHLVLKRLPSQQRDILCLSLNGKTVKEIAEELSISENTVKTHKKRAYQFVREQLGEMWGLFVILYLSCQ